MTTDILGERNALSDRKPIEIPGDCAWRQSKTAPASACASPRRDVRSPERRSRCPLPARIGNLEQRDRRLALCVGPDEWFILAPISGAKAIEDSFRTIAAPHSLVDVGHREVGVEISGPSASLLLNSGLALDLSVMPTASGTRTIFDKAPVILIKEAGDHYRIEVWQSFATHLWGLLAAASREIALGL